MADERSAGADASATVHQYTFISPGKHAQGPLPAV